MTEILVLWGMAAWRFGECLALVLSTG